MKRTLFSFAALATIAALSGCVTASPDVVHPYHTQRAARVHEATILSMRPVTVGGYETGAGAMTGAVAGSIAGASIGGYRDGGVGSVVGLVAGAVIGGAIERDATRAQAWEIIVQLRNGEQRAIIQGQGAEPLNPGDRVLLINTDGRVRVTRAPASMPDQQAAAPRLPPPVQSPARPADAAPYQAPYQAQQPAAPAAPQPAPGASAPIFTPRGPAN